jgi:hypothetical protein
VRLYARTRQQLAVLSKLSSRRFSVAARMILEEAVAAWARFPNFDTFLEALRKLNPPDQP